MLVVISIVGLLAAITLPTIRGFNKPALMTAATRQLMDDLARARQLAISQRTTVYMIFTPTNFWSDNPGYSSLNSTERDKSFRLFDKQMLAYAFVTMRQIGDQPGRVTPRYLSAWKTLPEGVFIAPQKFAPRTRNPVLTVTDPPRSTPSLPIRRSFDVFGFFTTNSIPFPSEGAAPTNSLRAQGQYVNVPYLAFNYLGQLIQPGQQVPLDHEIIPLARGNLNFARNALTKVATNQVPAISESPAGNVTNTFNLVYIEGLTGRAHLERQEVQ
jgi:type II secretory pathway pseudopilin PulG